MSRFGMQRDTPFARNLREKTAYSSQKHQRNNYCSRGIDRLQKRPQWKIRVERVESALSRRRPITAPGMEQLVMPARSDLPAGIFWPCSEAMIQSRIFSEKPFTRRQSPKPTPCWYDATLIM